MNGDLACIRDVLSQNVAIPNVLPGVKQLGARLRDTFDGVEERFAQHDVGQSALVHVEPDVVSPVSVPLVHEYHVSRANLHDCWSGRFHLRVIAMRQV